jgi:hypothetical protein
MEPAIFPFTSKTITMPLCKALLIAAVSFSESIDDVPLTVSECMTLNIMYISDRSSTVANLNITTYRPTRPFVGQLVVHLVVQLVVQGAVVLDQLVHFEQELP